jgi:hypothetical protein
VVKNRSVVRLVKTIAIRSATKGPAIAERKNLSILFIPNSNDGFIQDNKNFDNFDLAEFPIYQYWF